jgi:uncharacterized protein
MAIEEGRPIDLVDETRLNVASLLMEPVGTMRDIRIEMASLPLDDGLVAEQISALARLTRLHNAVLVSAAVQATVPMECVACLDEYDQLIGERFSETFRQTVDVRTGAVLPEPATEEDEVIDDEPAFTIDESHELDLGEAIRQWILLAIPMQPSCGPDCRGPLLRSTGGDEPVDNQFASLASLLDDGEPDK